MGRKLSNLTSFMMISSLALMSTCSIAPTSFINSYNVSNTPDNSKKHKAKLKKAKAKRNRKR